MQNYIIFSLILLLIIISLYFAFFWKKHKKLSQEKQREFQKKLKIISSHISSKEKIIDSDKLYHKILLEAGYLGDFGSILKQKPLIIDDLNKIWELHKIRNKLVHDFDNYAENILREKSKEFSREIEKLLKKLQ